MKDAIKTIEERKIHKQDMNDLQKQILSKNQKSNSEKMRLMNKHALDIEHVKQKHLTDMKDLEVEEESIL